MTRLPLLASHILLGKASAIRGGGSGAPPPPEVIAEVRSRYRALLDLDIANVKAGLYPKELLWRTDGARYARALPEAIRQLPGTLRRAKNQNFNDLPACSAGEEYPAYYQRNFHWQTDGYFSERSAQVYDIQVAWVFLGATTMMRRQVLPPLTRFANSLAKPMRVLDVATGTGQNLRQIRTAFPTAKLTGVDLSPYYLRHAQTYPELQGPHVSLIAENAESLSFPNNSFDVVTSIHLFHELPKDARRNVMREMFRVLRPGGLLVVQDSLQNTDSSIISGNLDEFAHVFHEPYYKGYLADPLGPAFESIGFGSVETESHYVSKNVIATKA